MITAVEQLKKHGFHSLSMRRVADACAISVGNLTYYYPTKSDLVSDIIDYVFEQYNTVSFVRAVPDQVAESETICIDEMIAWLMRDAATGETISLFTELWALGKHSKVGASSLATFYNTAIAKIKTVLAAEYPAVDTLKLHSAARLVQTISEGTVPVSAFTFSQEQLERDILVAIEAVHSLLKS